jgi:hypothetical protein
MATSAGTSNVGHASFVVVVAAVSSSSTDLRRRSNGSR